MIATIKNGKMLKWAPDTYPGPFMPGAEAVWLPDSYAALLNDVTNPGFVFPDDPRLTMSPSELAAINQVNSDRSQKVIDIQANLPSWNQVEASLNNINTMADAKAALKKLARVVYWLAKNSSI